MNVSANARTSARPASLTWILPVLVVVGAILRLLFISNEGFKNDVSSFEAWAITLAEHPTWQFYDKAGFADYPPGYLYILGFIGHLWALLFKHFDTGFVYLKYLVKLPAIVADLFVGVLLYRIVLHFSDERWALGAAALYLLNPATILISAMWGQVDAISGGLALLATYLLILAQESPGKRTSRVVWAWLALSYSLLIKPQTAAILIPLFIAYAFADREALQARLRATAIGVVAGLVAVLLLTLPFHPTLNPLDAFSWLLDRYRHGASVYAYNSVNAFNLWTIRGAFWQAENTTLGIPQAVLGAILVVAATALVIWRYLQARTSQALLESAALLTLAFFMLATRMHERYIFDGVLFVIACIGFARRYLIVAIVLSLVLWANLHYSLQYLQTVTQSLPGNATDLWGPLDHLLSFVNVAAFFYLGYMFLGSDEPLTRVSVSGGPGAAALRRPPATLTAPSEAVSGPRGWFDPREGLIGMAGIDYVLMSLIGLGSFILSYINYWIPREEIFDEIYFARAGEEYLKRLPIYESTHPPLTKLLITLSMMLFGGLHGSGDTSTGWRFLDVVFGAFVVMLLYAFAKRITGSTVFSAIAALLFTFDGMHFVQSRIATPEGFVVFFSLAAAYAFYRFWIAEQVSVRAYIEQRRDGAIVAIAAAAALALGFLISWLVVGTLFKQSVPAIVVAGVYFALGIYLLLRLFAAPRVSPSDSQEIGYAEGSVAVRGPDNSLVLTTADGGVLDSRSKNARRGAVSQAKGGSLYYEAEELEIVYNRDASVAYRTPEGDALYTPGRIEAGGLSQNGSHSKFWLFVFTAALGCLVSSKWYGVMGFGVSFLILILVWLQRYWIQGRRPALWGNPRGYRLDVALVSIVFISATVYGLVWTKDVVNQADIHNLSDVVLRQYSMYEYHANLRATHPYSSKWWEWPIDYVPVTYYYKDLRHNHNDNNEVGVREITSLPNPAILWAGLITVPFVGVLAWYQRRKAYALIVIAYLLQWLPWARSPRLAFSYHFYVDIPLICLCNVIALQWVWNRYKDRDDTSRIAAGVGIGAYVALVALLFVFFYPVLAAQPLSWTGWHERMWIDKWVVGPG